MFSRKIFKLFYFQIKPVIMKQMSPMRLPYLANLKLMRTIKSIDRFKWQVARDDVFEKHHALLHELSLDRPDTRDHLDLFGRCEELFDDVDKIIDLAYTDPIPEQCELLKETLMNLIEMAKFSRTRGYPDFTLKACARIVRILDMHCHQIPLPLGLTMKDDMYWNYLIYLKLTDSFRREVYEELVKSYELSKEPLQASFWSEKLEQFSSSETREP